MVGLSRLPSRMSVNCLISTVRCCPASSGKVPSTRPQPSGMWQAEQTSNTSLPCLRSGFSSSAFSRSPPLTIHSCFLPSVVHRHLGGVGFRRGHVRPPEQRLTRKNRNQRESDLRLHVPSPLGSARLDHGVNPPSDTRRAAVDQALVIIDSYLFASVRDFAGAQTALLSRRAIDLRQISPSASMSAPLRRATIAHHPGAAVGRTPSRISLICKAR